MALGGTAKKLQKVINAAEELYAKMNEVIGQVNELREEVEVTSQQVDRIEYDMAQQRAILEAVAEQQGVDVEDVLADADLPPEPETEAGDAEADADGQVTDGDAPAGSPTGGEATEGGVPADSRDGASGQGDTDTPRTDG